MIRVHQSIENFIKKSSVRWLLGFFAVAILFGQQLEIKANSRRTDKTAVAAAAAARRTNSTASALAMVVTRLDQSQKDQLANRTANVKTWCEAINQGRDYDRRFVAQFHIPYRLPDLPCNTLASKTKASAHPKSTTVK